MAADPSLLHRVDRANWFVYTEVAARSGGDVRTDVGLVLITGVHPSPVIVNTAFRTQRDPGVPAPAILERVAGHFSAVGHGASLMTAEHNDRDLEEAASSAGWRAVITLPGMVVRTPLGRPSPPEEVSLRWVDPARDLGEFRRIVMEGFAENDDEREMVASVFAQPRSLEPPGVRATVATLEDVGVAAGTVYRSEGVGVVGWVATVPQHRRRGLGTVVTTALTDAAFAHGADIVCLQASPMGRSVYERMGFETITNYRIWIPPR